MFSKLCLFFGITFFSTISFAQELTNPPKFISDDGKPPILLESETIFKCKSSNYKIKIFSTLNKSIEVKSIEYEGRKIPETKLKLIQDTLNKYSFADYSLKNCSENNIILSFLPKNPNDRFFKIIEVTIRKDLDVKINTYSGWIK